VASFDAQRFKRLARSPPAHRDQADRQGLRGDGPDPRRRVPDTFATMVRLERGRRQVAVLFEGGNGPSGASCSAGSAACRRTWRSYASTTPPRSARAQRDLCGSCINEGGSATSCAARAARARDRYLTAYRGAALTSGSARRSHCRCATGRAALRGSARVVPRLTTAHNFRLRSLGISLSVPARRPDQRARVLPLGHARRAACRACALARSCCAAVGLDKTGARAADRSGPRSRQDPAAAPRSQPRLPPSRSWLPRCPALPTRWQPTTSITTRPGRTSRPAASR
jgi:hypothetical protein